LFSLHKISVSVLLFVFASCASGQDLYIVSAGADQAGMGYSCIAKPGFWSSFSNQASLAFRKQLSAGINYENRFNIKELGTRTAGIVIPAGKTTLGIVYSNFGYKYFSRHKAGIACGLNLSEKLAAGVQIDYLLEHTPGEYPQKNALTFEAGVLFDVSEKTRLGFRIFNPVPEPIRKSYLPSAIEAGTQINLSRQVSATAQAEMSTGRNVRISMGLEYRISARLQLRGGFSSGNTLFCFGMGYNVKSVAVDLGFMIHDRLGVSSSLSIVYEINKQ
jgi:long-subunit fatty acid transport protein